MVVHPAKLRFVDQSSGDHRLIGDDDAEIPVRVNRLKRLHDARENPDLTCVRQQVDLFYENAIAIEKEGAFALHALFGFSHLWKYAVIR
jgi:hypothetical protein